MKKAYLLLLFFILVSKTIAQNYEVSGAGTAAVNGTYSPSGTTAPGYTKYVKAGSPTYYMYYDDFDWRRWIISTSDYMSMGMPAYYNNSSSSTPPSSGWNTFDGMPPSPSVSIAGPKLTYSGSLFTETSSNNGSIDNSSPITVTHNNYGGGTFTGSNGDNFIVAGKVTVTNLPSGLTAVITRTSSTVLSVTITGTANSHANANDVSTLTFTFQNSAFSTSDASAVTNSTKSDLSVNFIDQLEVPSAFGTIASAISAAGNGDIINIAAGTYTEANLSVSNKSLRFVGQSPATTIIQPSATYNTAASRVISCTFDSYSTSNQISFSNLTMRYGKIIPTPGWGQPGRGGALYSHYANVTIDNCEIVSNVHNDGVDSWYGGGGGGLNIVEGNLTINSTTFANNSVNMREDSPYNLAGGGAILFHTGSISGLVYNITNCTFNGNSCNISGGAIVGLLQSSASVSIINSTFYGNSSRHGGAFFSKHDAGYTLEFKNCIFNGNTASTAGVDLYSTVSVAASISTCLLQTTSGGNITGYDSFSTSNAGADPQLSALADNGGVTRTMALQSGSPAIDAGTSSGAPSTDQRGYSRTGSIDIGSYEYNASPLPVQLVSFNAVNAEGRIQLLWQTATEVNNYGFDIERKIENENWVKISFVQGHGNSNSQKSYSFTDLSPVSGKVQYRLKQIDLDGKYEYSDIVELDLEAPTKFVLNQNHPNPFNPETTISYQLPYEGNVTLKVFDLLGREVADLVNTYAKAGKYDVKFDGSKLASGIYFYKLSAGSFSKTNKMLLIK